MWMEQARDYGCLRWLWLCLLAAGLALSVAKGASAQCAVPSVSIWGNPMPDAFITLYAPFTIYGQVTASSPCNAFVADLYEWDTQGQSWTYVDVYGFSAYSQVGNCSFNVEVTVPAYFWYAIWGVEEQNGTNYTNGAWSNSYGWYDSE